VLACRDPSPVLVAFILLLTLGEHLPDLEHSPGRAGGSAAASDLGENQGQRNPPVRCC
jgi:hypothetical protein